MQFGFSTYFFVKQPLHGVLDAIVTSGLTTVEISCEIPHGLNMDREFRRRVANLKGRGYTFSVHAPFFELNLGSFFDGIRSLSKERIRYALDLAGELGCDPVVVHPGYSFLINKVKFVEEQTRNRFIEDLGELSEYGATMGVRIALENVFMPFFFFYDLPDFLELKKALPLVGITLDTGHAYVGKCMRHDPDPEGAIIEDIKRIGIEHFFHVHLHNNLGARDDHLFLEGAMDMGRILRALSDLGYKGKVIIESYDMEEQGIPAVLRKLESLTPAPLLL